MSNARERRHGLVDPALAAEIEKDLPNKRLDQQRQMKFFVTPGGPRLTEYEVLTMYAQQGTDWASGGLEIGDSMQRWPGGRPTYAPEVTEVKTTDWWRFRDPESRWFFPYIKQKAEEGRLNQRFMLTASADGAVRTIDPYWLREIVSTQFGAFLFNEYGLHNAHAAAVHDCLSDIVRVFFSNVAFDKADAAQLIQTQRLFLHKLVPSTAVELDDPKASWTTSKVYRGARRTVEALWEDTYDHIECMWATHAIYDAIFGQYVRREFFQRLAPLYGDTLTPWFMAQTISFHHYAAQGIRALCFDMLLGDIEFGDLNRRWLQVWTRKWLPMTMQALSDFLSLYGKIAQFPGMSDAQGVRTSLERVIGDWAEDFGNPIGHRIDVKATVDSIIETAAII